MKKSRSLKLSDIERLTSSPIRRTITQLGKPLALGVPATAAVAKKQQPVFKASDGSPNYMKSTSCFDARKEKSQVSLRNAQTSPGRKNLNRRSCSHSKHGSGSGNKPERSLTRTSSLKLVRTLTKTPSFKPARASAKKSSRVVLCEDIDAQRSTCSSTQKDSKFPAYLMLSPGATESEGTSVTKVCPYTYCSLNGHRHSHLPPLKCFLSARRRLVKTQKSMKMEALTPRRAKRSSEGTEEIETPKLIVDDKPALVESDIVNLAKPYLLQDGGQDFFIEIYTKCKDTDSEAMGKGTYREKEDTIDAAVEVEDQNDTASSIDWGDEAMAGHMGSQAVAESVSDQSAKSEVEFAETLDQYGDVATPEIDTVERFPGEQVEDANGDFLPILAQEKKTMGSFCTGSNFEGEWIGSEAIDMEWEEGHLTASEITSEADYSVRTDSEFDGEFGCPLQNNRLDSEGFPLKMVQRKVPNSNKLGIQADHVKYDKLLANLKPSSSQSHDGKNRGADLKKKMKKSRSLKLSDIERLG
ncbi:hypothetical protein CJ030_MR1G019998 [Morella rubra]|uniref:Uncharacterized protein n=1 Tax=Morella rubra TaxID=262757 RepID=A0A6A1WQJ4_9ROSI|nr:hypothetical protein CJ030_MR1G019998 [Morella rubra]